jgi:hypothetical protein
VPVEEPRFVRFVRYHFLQGLKEHFPAHGALGEWTPFEAGQFRDPGFDKGIRLPLQSLREKPEPAGSASVAV